MTPPSDHDGIGAGLAAGERLCFPGLRDRVAIVTGAGSGIGREAAGALAQAGAYVALAGRRLPALEQTAAALNPARCLVVPCDVRDDDQVAHLVARTCGQFGRLDLALNNAGSFGARSLLHEDTASNFDAVVNTNLRGLWSCLKYELAAMLQSAGGSIVNVASVSAHIGHAESPVYAATKHAILGISRSAALQYAHAGIRVNVVSPGSTDTELLVNLYPQAEERAARGERAPLQRLGRPQEIANAALWLMSPLSSYVTGQVLIVDGGVTAGNAWTPRSSTPAAAPSQSVGIADRSSGSETDQGNGDLSWV